MIGTNHTMVNSTANNLKATVASAVRKQHEFKNLQVDLTYDDTADSLSELIGALRCSKSNETMIVVEREFPYRIRSASSQFSQVFQFKEKEFASSSLRLLFGPETNVPAIRSVIGGRIDCASQPQLPLTLYRKDGDEVSCSMRVVSASSDNNTVSLALDLDSSCQAPPPASPCATGFATRIGECEPIALETRMYAAGEIEAPTSSLLSEDAGLAKVVAIHVLAIRRAAAASAAGRRARRADDNKMS
jgi:hypothetical protein